MPVISSYALQYSNVNFAAISSSTFDLFITEGAPLAPGGGFPAITDSQVAQLQAQGRTVVGYVNVAVTDDARYYWNPAWTTNGHDTGTPDGDAPSWLQGATPLNFDGIPGQDALIVNFWDAGWKDIVIDQAVNLVSRGYDGVFLDDVGRYYTLGAPGGVPSIRAMANLMCQFVAEIEAAIEAINPDAYVVVNSDPYLTTNTTLDGTGAAAAAAYLAAVDAHLLENQSAAAIDYAANVTLTGETRLILESDGSPAYNFADSWARGILYTTTSYGAAGTFAYPATAGADTLAGGDGPNQIGGLGGNDNISGGGGADYLYGADGDDTILGGADADQLFGQNGNDTIGGDSGNDYVEGGAGLDYLYGVDGNDTLLGGGDADQLFGQNGNDTIGGDGGNDYVEGGAGADYLYGVDGNDTILGGADADQLFGQDGNDTIGGDGGNDYVEGGAGADYLYGVDGNDTILGGADADQLYGQDGNDILGGDDGGDTIEGGIGDDVIYGGGANDQLVGGSGSDIFAFTTALGAANVDVVHDFATGLDKIALDDAVFGLPAGALNANAFVIGSAAADGTDRIVYNSGTGALLFDSDGIGGAAAVQFATLAAGLNLTAGDLYVF